jgi:hypothetical protein
VEIDQEVLEIEVYFARNIFGLGAVICDDGGIIGEIVDEGVGGRAPAGEVEFGGVCCSGFLPVEEKW